MASTIMNTIKGECYLCGRHGYTEEHHVFEGTSNRSISEQEGLKVWLCPECHRVGNYSIHMDPGSEMAIKLKKDAQKIWEWKYREEHKEYGNSALMTARLEFLRLFGKSYLDMTEFL